MKRSQLWLEGAQWARELVGLAEGEECIGVCERIKTIMQTETRPADYRAGALALVDAALSGPGTRMAP